MALVTAYSVSFRSRNASTSSLSWHTLQTGGSLRSTGTGRSNGSLLRRRNKQLAQRQKQTQTKKGLQVTVYWTHAPDVSRSCILADSLKPNIFCECSVVIFHISFVYDWCCHSRRRFDKRDPHSSLFSHVLLWISEDWKNLIPLTQVVSLFSQSDLHVRTCSHVPLDVRATFNS